MRLDEDSNSRVNLTDDEIWARLEEAWRRQLAAGAHASPEIYRAALSEVLRSFVSEKREGATLAMRQFAERHLYESVQDRLAQAAQGVAVAAPRSMSERKLGSAEQRMVDQAKAEGRAQARMGFLVALLGALVLLLVYVLDHTPAKLTWGEIPQTVSASVSWHDSWLRTEADAATWMQGSWRLEQSRRRESFDDKQWFVSLRTQACEDAVTTNALNDDAAARATAQALAHYLALVPQAAPAVQHINYGFDRYIARVHYSVTPVAVVGSAGAPDELTVAAGSVTESAIVNPARAWFETAQLTVPDGLSALSVVMARYTLASQVPAPEEMVARAAHTIGGRTLLCKAPTIWGWWFDRDRYLE